LSFCALCNRNGFKASNILPSDNHTGLNAKNQGGWMHRRIYGNWRTFFTAVRFCSGLAALMLIWGCAAKPGTVMINDTSTAFEAGTIISAASGKAVSFDEMMADLDYYQMIFVGEKHGLQSNHANELEIIKAVFKNHRSMEVGMEMFDRSYQQVLDLWSAGVLDEATFLRKVQWYANWRYDFGLYRDILLFIKSNKIKLVALNIPSYIASRIRVGGIENLLDADKSYLPKEIDTQNTAYRDYVEKAFNQHHFSETDKFDDFYMAQCVWDEAMAESVASNLGNRKIVVLAGNGHIQRNYGIPDRAFRRTQTPFRTVYQASVGEEVELSVADYIWITPAD
jgi:uncharacterized iron-regulated protein